MNKGTEKIRSIFKRTDKRVLLTILAFLAVAVAAVFVFGFYRTRSRELRDSVPGSSLAYLEIKDVGAVYGSILTNASNAKTGAPDFLDGIEAAVAITGFEASEQTLTARSSVLNIKPTFAAIVDTNAWRWQVDGLIDGPLNDFIRDQYGNKTKRSKHAGKYGDLLVWTAPDGRKSFAVKEGSRIILGNDLAAVESCQSASKGEVQSLLGDSELQEFYSENDDSQVIGYFPRRSIEKFADMAGVSAAVSGSEQEGIRAFISRLVPQMLRNGVDSVTWTSRNRLQYFEDHIRINTRNEVSEVFAETMKPAKADWERIADFLPEDTGSVTHYNLQNPLIAYRSLILTAAKSADPVSGRLIAAFSDSMLQPYGVSDAEAFLATVGPELVTLQTHRDEDASAAIAIVKDREGLIKVLERSIGTSADPNIADGTVVWVSVDKSAAAAIAGDVLVLGDRGVVLDALKKKGKSSRLAGTREFNSLIRSEAPAATVGRDSRNYGFQKSTKSENAGLYFSETSFSKHGITRRYESRFGLIGTLVDGFGN